jgi:hypothetical protein
MIYKNIVWRELRTGDKAAPPCPAKRPAMRKRRKSIVLETAIRTRAGLVDPYGASVKVAAVKGFDG